VTDASSIPPITGKVSVNVPIEKAFEVFAGSFDTWWPHEYHIGPAEVAEIVLEPRIGGRWYERGVDGTECDWGRVLAWEPPNRLVFTWQINGQWQFDADPEHASEIEATFTADGPDRTTVAVEQRNFDRLSGGAATHDTIESGGGWIALLASYAKTVADS
jgi:uncharacterized protein YndB with AHSA1/START domain